MSYCFGAGGDLLRITQVAPFYWRQILVKQVYERNSGRDVQLHDLLVGDSIQVLDQGAEAVAVRHHEHDSTGSQVGHDGVVPVGQHPHHDVLETLSPRQNVRRQRCVAMIMAGVPFVAGVQRRRPHVVTAPPDLDLLLAEPFGGLSLVQALEGPIVPLVQPPGAVHRKPGQLQDFERAVGRLNRSQKHRGVQDTRPDILRRHRLGGRP